MKYPVTRWTGADSNPGNNAGNGRAGTDRNNIVLLREITYPKEGAWEDAGPFENLFKTLREPILSDILVSITPIIESHD
jgi:hypothetical protein